MGACPQRVGIGPEASRCDVDAGPTVGPGRRHLHGRRRHLRHQPRRHAALALRDRRARRVGAGACCPTARWSPAARTTSSTPSRPTGRSAGTSGPAPTSRRRPPSATTARSTSAPTTTSSTRWPRRGAALGVHDRGRRSRVGRGRQRRRLRRLVRFADVRRPPRRQRWRGHSAPATASCRRRWSTRAAPSCSARRTTACIVSSLTATCAGRSSSAATSTARRCWPRTAPSSSAPTTASSTRSARRQRRRPET